MNINNDFLDRCDIYFREDKDKFINLLDKPLTHGLFLNTNKTCEENIIKLIDFDIKKSNFNKNAYYHTNLNIGKSIVNELGLIYPQGVESSLFTNYLNDINPKLIVDMCAAPGGKSIVAINKFKDALCISNDVNSSRANEMAKNFERLGLDKTIITSTSIKNLENNLKGNADLVILDAPCSGEGMIRKYDEILNNYDVSNINSLAIIQKDLLESAYNIASGDSYIVYSTCTYAFEEDENQINDFLKRHNDLSLINISINEKQYSSLNGTIKLCQLNNCEGQFISIIKKKSNLEKEKLQYLKPIKNKIVDTFINNNLNINNYYLYENNNHFYLSLIELIKINGSIRSGIYLGELKKDRFEPAHNLYRSNSLFNYFKYRYDLKDDEYLSFIKGLEIKVNLENAYYLVTYKGYSLGYGKVSNNTLKNKYPKGLRR